MALGWDTAPGCIQHGVAGSDGVYAPYEKCADYFTFGPGSTFGTSTSGVTTSYWILTIIGDHRDDRGFRRLGHDRGPQAQAAGARLLVSGHAGQVDMHDRPKDPHTPSPGLGGPSDLGDV